MGESQRTRIHTIVADQLGLDPREVTENASILEDLGADSLDVVEMVMMIEEAFDLEIPDEEIEVMRTIGDVERYVSEHVV